MIRKFLNNKEIIYSAYFWEVENGEKDQYIAQKEMCVWYPFVVSLLLPKARIADFLLAELKMEYYRS